ncbi:MAG: YraN family protein [Alphaproteobacteria bacterium]|nr:YraN family protein [Alphaproteobacteria bacterium]
MPASSNANRKKFERRGRAAETAALILLTLKGYRLLARRFNSRLGEIDLIMRKGETTAFIEVKARSTMDAAVASVTPYQSKRIAAAASLWMARDAKAAQGFCRFDIVAVNAYLWPAHIPNAFSGV